MKYFVAVVLIACLTLVAEGATQDSLRADTLAPRPTITVSASRIPLALEEAARTIDLLKAQDLERVPMRSIQDALVLIPGVDLRTRGPYGAQADVSIRGGSYEQTAVLLNGMRLTDPQTGHHQLNLPLAPWDIERVEVVKGGASRLFGPGAMDGAVNIVPRAVAGSQARASVIGGDYGYAEGRLTASLRTGNVANTLSGQYVKHNGYRQSTDLDLKSMLITGDVVGESASLAWLGGVIDKSFGAGLFYSPRFPDAWERTVTWLGGLKGTMEFNNVWSGTLTGLYRANSDEFLLKRDDPSFYRNTHTTHTVTVTALTTARWQGAILTLGGEAGTENIVSSNLGDHDRVRGGMSAELRVPLGSVNITAGGNFMSFSDRTPGIGYGADVQWNVWEEGRIFGTVNRSYRIPTYTELYYRDPTTRGNSTLSPEHAITAEIGGSYTIQNVEFRVSGFMRDGRNLIDYVQLGAEPVFTAENVERVQIYGTEFVVGYNLRNSWEGSPLTSLRWTVNYATVESTVSATTRYTMDQLRWQSIIRADVELPLEIGATFTMRFVERYTDRVMRSVGDLRVMRTFGPIRILAEASNLWNTNMVEVGWVPIAPRWFRAGIEATVR